MTRTVIVSAARTPIGSFQGALSQLRAPDIGAVTIRSVCDRSKVDPSSIDGVIMGCVLPAGLGQSPARQASLAADLPDSVGVLTVNKVCSSGLVSIMLADKTIRAGDAEIVVAGGMESMSNPPYYLPNARGGLRMGDSKLVDGMIFDGLWDIYSDTHMGTCAELCAEKYSFTREMQDAYAIESYNRAQRAIADGLFKEEIAPVEVPQRKGNPVICDTDEEPSRVNFEKLPTLKAPFKKDGTITPANASSISDGAASVRDERREGEEAGAETHGFDNRSCQFFAGSGVVYNRTGRSDQGGAEKGKSFHFRYRPFRDQRGLFRGCHGCDKGIFARSSPGEREWRSGGTGSPDRRIRRADNGYADSRPAQVR